MKLIIIIIVLIILICLPVVRCILFHPVSTVYYAVRDLYEYIRYKKYNLLKTGNIYAYNGNFGRGKTLSVVHEIVRRYRKKDGKTVYCPERKKFVKQRVKIISNVNLNVPYERFVSLEQIIRQTENRRKEDADKNTLTVTLVLGDEFSVQLNSRNFKSNIDPLLLNSILTCRHNYISIYYTSQRFMQVDALLRQVTQDAIECHKIWRIQKLSLYDAWDLENCSNPQNIKPNKVMCWFVKNKDYNAYDTYAMVNNLKNSYKYGDMMSEAEILQLQCNTPDNMDMVTKVSRKYKKQQKKMYK